MGQADLERARTELNSDRLPHLEGVVLADALAQALGAGNVAEAAAVHTSVRSRCERLAASLAKWPERQRRFLQFFPPAC